MPANGDTAAYIDTRLQITFDSTPTLGTSGTIKVYKTSDSSLVDTIDVSAAVVTAGGETQTTLAKTNTEIDALAGNVTSLGSRYRYVYYSPVSISGNTASIKLHDGKLAYGTSYYATIDNGVLNGNVGGSAFSGVAASAWNFTTKAAPSSYTSITVAATGTADFRSVQGALNWVMDKCASGTANSCITTDKTIAVKNGTYNELLFLRNTSNLTIAGESRAGTVIQYENFEHYNPGSGTSATAVAATLTTEGTGTRRTTGGGRAVFLIEGGDMVKLTNFTLQNTHVKGSYGGTSGLSLNNQAETFYFNSATLTGSRLIASYMNFFSTQDTIQTKGWAWFYQSLITGDVDFIWGSPFAAMFEETEVRTVVDTTNAASGGYILQSRAAYGYPGFVFLNSSLTSASGVPAGATYLARSAGLTPSTYCTTMFTTGSIGNAHLYCDNAAYINTKMGSHIATTGWYISPVPYLGPTATTGWRESGSMDAGGAALSMSGRDTTYGSSSADLSGLNTRTKVFSMWNSSAGWVPAP